MRYVIGDIHGGSKTFLALLKQISLKHDDTLYLLGDYVDRGADSKGVLDTILRLLSNGFDVRPVRGNHDDMMLRTFTGEHDEYSEFWLESWSKVVLKSFGVDKIQDVPARYTTFLKELPFSRCDDQFVFVHAGLDMSRNDPIHQSGCEYTLWRRTGYVDLAKLGGRRLITGHTIHNLEQIRSSLTTIHIRLDNGAFTNLQPRHGNLLALNLEAMELFIQPWLDGYAVY
ncbi:MAG: metallophosphoesterase family protein [Desulfuromonadaceae bacterium]|nr:metallophosphoesterase family protein [Desulfuromonadaceae bacterium]